MRKILSASPLLRVEGVVVGCVAVGLVLLSVVRQTRGSSLDVSSDQYLIPGNQWSTDGKTITNPSYFDPAAYRIFDAF